MHQSKCLTSENNFGILEFLTVSLTPNYTSQASSHNKMKTFSSREKARQYAKEFLGPSGRHFVSHPQTKEEVETEANASTINHIVPNLHNNWDDNHGNSQVIPQDATSLIKLEADESLSLESHPELQGDVIVFSISIF